MVDLPQRHFLLLFDPSMEDFLERHFLLLLGKSDIEIAGKLGQNFLTRILKNFFTKKCFYGSSNDPPKIWGQYFFPFSLNALHQLQSDFCTCPFSRFFFAFAKFLRFFSSFLCLFTLFEALHFKFF